MRKKNSNYGDKYFKEKTFEKIQSNLSKENILISPGIFYKTVEMNFSQKKDLIYEILKIIGLFIIIIILIFCVLLFGKKLFSNYCFNDNHIEVIMEYKEPTSSTTGLTEGKKCSRCGKILIEQKEIPRKYKVKFMWNNICLSEKIMKNSIYFDASIKMYIEQKIKEYLDMQI